MKKIVLAAAAMLAAFAAFAAPPADNVASTPTPPTGACRDAAPLVLSRSNGHLYGCVSGAWHDWTAAMLAGISVNSIVGDVTIDGSLAATGTATAATFRGEVDLTTDPSYPAGLIRDGLGFQARANAGGYVTLAPGALHAGSWSGDVILHAPYGAVRVEGSALAPYHSSMDLGMPDDPFGVVYAYGMDLDQDGSLDLGAVGQAKFFHGTADDAGKLGGYVPTYFAADSAVVHLAGAETITATKTIAISGTGVGIEVKNSSGVSGDSRSVRITNGTGAYWDVVATSAGNLSFRLGGT
ncbi:hypothetical protein LLG88_00155, partial [bacterium]|nr:hypothetical protein [bacterium]